MARTNRPSPRQGGERPAGGSSRPNRLSGERELIVIAKREAGLRAQGERVSSVAGADVTPLADVLASDGATMRPLFGLS